MRKQLSRKNKFLRFISSRTLGEIGAAIQLLSFRGTY